MSRELLAILLIWYKWNWNRIFISCIFSLLQLYMVPTAFYQLTEFLEWSLKCKKKQISSIFESLYYMSKPKHLPVYIWTTWIIYGGPILTQKETTPATRTRHSQQLLCWSCLSTSCIIHLVFSRYAKNIIFPFRVDPSALPVLCETYNAYVT